MTDALAPKPGIDLSDEQRLSWLRLIRSDNIGPATFVELINHFGSASDALEALPDLAARGRARKSMKIASPAAASRELEALAHHGGSIVCLGEKDYPPALRAADNPPPVISVRGNRDILSRDAVAFVGSRNASMAGVKLTGQLARDVGAEGFSIVSGLARGIDSAAHRASLVSGTVAIFAGGVDHIYPPENVGLVDDILKTGGAVVSEMPLGWKPRAQDFPRRNRIVAGMSLGLVVVEAARRSGSLISARLANEMGRLVFAVPGSPLDPRSEGANHLIKQGAQLITSASDIVDAMRPIAADAAQSTYSLNETDRDEVECEQANETDRDRLLAALGHAPTDVDDIMQFTGLPPGKLQLMVLEMEIAGTIERHTGNRISLAG
ncbi:MAG: DNA-processing protein DprA [Pseudomonadota bacterium]